MGSSESLNKWSVYLLSNGTRTYIGATTNVIRRLRQHNGEIVGGARSTRTGRPWKLLRVLHGFENRSVCYRWEKLLKLRARGVRDRMAAFELLAAGTCPPGRRHYEPPTGITISAIPVAPVEKRTANTDKEGDTDAIRIRRDVRESKKRIQKEGIPSPKED